MENKRLKQKRRIRKVLWVFLVFFIMFAPVSSGENCFFLTAKAASSPKLSKKTLKLNMGDTYRLYLTNLPQGKKGCSYGSRNIFILDADDGYFMEDGSFCVVLSPKRVGTTVVDIDYDGKTYSCRVTVEQKTALSATTQTLKKGSSFTLRLNNAASSAVKWSVSDKGILRLRKLSKNTYKVTGLKNGTAYVNAKLGSKTYRCKVTVKAYLTKYSYKITQLSKNSIYDSIDGVFYIKTRNPNPDSIKIDGIDSVTIGSFGDIRYLKNDRTSTLRKVKDGYLLIAGWDTSGRKTIKIGEIVNHETAYAASFKVNVKSYKSAYDRWLDNLLSKVTKSSMTDKEKMDALCAYILKTFTYQTNQGGRLTTLVSDMGPYWSVRKIDCIEATEIMMSLAKKLGLKREATYAGYLNHYYATVWIDGKPYTYDASPFAESGEITQIKYIL